MIKGKVAWFTADTFENTTTYIPVSPEFDQIAEAESWEGLANKECQNVELRLLKCFRHVRIVTKTSFVFEDAAQEEGE